MLDKTYVEFVKFACWKPKDSEWKKREKKIKVIGRCPFVSPTDHDRFALRILLHHVKGIIFKDKIIGAKSFEDLKRYNNVLYPTFKAACVARGLLDDDIEFLQCMQEAAQSRSPRQLRSLFVSILAFNSPGNVRVLWDEMYQDMIEDFIRNHNEESSISLALQDIDEQLRKIGTNVTNYNLPELISIDNSGECRLIQEHITFGIDARNRPDETHLMTMEQREFFNIIMESLSYSQNDTRSKLFFLDAPAGYGKTFVENALIYKIRSEGKIVLAVASSGIASLLLPHGTTAHSQFKIPINLLDTSTCTVSAQSDLACLLKKADMICWDEAPMHHKLGFEAVQRTLKDLTGKDNFGNKVVLFSGDFRQTLPIIPKGNRATIVSSSLSRCSFWPRVRIFKLTKNMRLEAPNLSERQIMERSEYAHWLLEIGNGRIKDVIVPESFLLRGSIDDLIEKIYPDLLNVDNSGILSATNISVDEINNKVLSKLPGEGKVYLSCDTVGNTDTAAFPVDFLNRLNISGLPPHQLHLKVGAIVMLLRNLNPSNGLMNGTRLKILSLMERVIKVEIITGTCIGTVHFIPRIKLIPSDSTLPFEMSRIQFPIKLAYAMTINKSQGQSMNRVGLFLQNQVFSHGQLYVALSRATSPDRVSVLLPERTITATNVVFREALAV